MLDIYIPFSFSISAYPLLIHLSPSNTYLFIFSYLFSISFLSLLFFPLLLCFHTILSHVHNMNTSQQHHMSHDCDFVFAIFSHVSLSSFFYKTFIFWAITCELMSPHISLLSFLSLCLCISFSSLHFHTPSSSNLWMVPLRDITRCTRSIVRPTDGLSSRHNQPLGVPSDMNGPSSALYRYSPYGFNY